MKRNRNNQIKVTLAQEFLAALCHQPPQRLTERNFAAILELLHHLPERMPGSFICGIAGPGPGANEVRGTRQTSSAEVIISARVQEWAPTDRAQRMGNEAYLRPARGAEVFCIPPIDSAAASAASRRVKPVNQPIETIRKCRPQNWIHDNFESIRWSYPSQARKVRFTGRKSHVFARFVLSNHSCSSYLKSRFRA